MKKSDILISHILQKRLVSISQMRNGIAHAIPNRSKPSWSDVSFILRLAKKYRRMKT